jgi:hypothetical protein
MTYNFGKYNVQRGLKEFRKVVCGCFKKLVSLSVSVTDSVSKV